MYLVLLKEIQRHPNWFLWEGFHTCNQSHFSTDDRPVGRLKRRLREVDSWCFSLPMKIKTKFLAYEYDEQNEVGLLILDENYSYLTEKKVLTNGRKLTIPFWCNLLANNQVWNVQVVKYSLQYLWQNRVGYYCTYYCELCAYSEILFPFLVRNEYTAPEKAGGAKWSFQVLDITLHAKKLDLKMTLNIHLSQQFQYF